jgi:hypothetical protein
MEFTGVELIGGIEFTALVEKAVADPCAEEAHSRRETQ